MHNNKIVVDLNKIQYASYGYRNQWNNWSPTKLKYSVYGKQYNPDDFSFCRDSDFAGETMDESARRLKLKDIWQPEVKLQLQANHRLVYTGKKAQSIWREWCRKQFNKKGK